MKAVAVALIFLGGTAFAKDHSAKYQVGTLTETNRIQDVNIYGSALANASTAFSHNQHLVETDEGVYVIEAPTSAGGSILMAMATNNQAPSDIHIRWFMDDMHSGDKVLFYSECNKRNDCTFFLPKPDKVGKEFHTSGHFYPNVAKTNTTQLCGTGKLSAAIAAQVCK
jgi:hypothetical protein